MSTSVTGVTANPLFGIGNSPATYILNTPPITGVTAEVPFPITITLAPVPLFTVPSNAFCTAPVVSEAAGRVRVTPGTFARVTIRFGLRVSTTALAPAVPADLPTGQFIVRIYNELGSTVSTRRYDLPCAKYNGATTEYSIVQPLQMAYSTARTFFEIGFAFLYVGPGGSTGGLSPSTGAILIE